MRNLIVLAIVACLCPALAGEVEECQRLAPKYGAETEVRLWDASRVDLMSEQYAIEVDWAPKWAEAIGQSLYYSTVTGKDPGIILLLKGEASEDRHIFRCQTVCARLNIRLFLEPAELDTGAAD